MTQQNISNTYHDFDTQKKRQLKQKILSECQISKRAFYNYLDGKQPSKIIYDRILSIINSFKQL